LIHGEKNEQIAVILNRYSLYCGSCHKSISKTIKQAASYHGLGMAEINKLIKEINTILNSES
jgi:hypothetical protein